MSDLKGVCEALLSRTNAVDMSAVALTVLYTVPPGKVAIITKVVIVNPSASLAGAGATDYDFGTGVLANTWLQGVNLTTLTTLNTDSIVISSDNVKYSENAAADAFAIKVIVGSSAACTATIMVFGFEIDA